MKKNPKAGKFAKKGNKQRGGDEKRGKGIQRHGGRPSRPQSDRNPSGRKFPQKGKPENRIKK
jgi:hypothetical protein